MHIAICDDVPHYNQQLHALLESYLSATGVNFAITEFGSGQALLDAPTNFEKPFDYIFLDVDMPGMDGFQTADHIRKTGSLAKAGLVFVTNMASQMRQGYKYAAKDYLTKPITAGQIAELMDRLLAEQQQKIIGKTAETYAIKLKHDEGTMQLPLADVIYFESMDRDILATTVSEAFTFRATLAEVEQDMQGKSENFVRIHRSYLVNKRHVFRQFGDKIVLKNGEELAVSRKYRDGMK